MDLRQTQRPRAEVEAFNDPVPRRKCTVCCGLRCALLTGGIAFLITLPCNAVMLGGRVTEGLGWRGFCNRNLFIPLPLALITFTHQLILSEGLWSKKRKTIWEINWMSALSNMSLWVVGTTICTVASRRWLPPCSRTYRLLLWEYRRTRRGCANPWFPTAFGRITEDLDWYNIILTLNMYHIVWAMIANLLEKEMGANYAMFYRGSQYSRWCSPRWREWRELEIQRKLHTEHKILPDRWGSFLSNNKWKVRHE